MKAKAGVINTLARPLGIEVEFSNVQAIYQPAGAFPQEWHWEHDGTLTHGGQELVLSPECGDGFIRRTAKLIDHIHTYKPAVDKTCGFHVHAQASDVEWFDLRRLIAIWCRIEHQLYGTVVEANRRGNRYCMPLAINAPSEQREHWQFLPSDVVAMMRKRLTYTKNSSGVPVECGTHKIKRWLVKKLYDIEFTEHAECPVVPRVTSTEYERFSREQRLEYQRAQSGREAFMMAANKFDRVKTNKRTNNGHGGCRYASLNIHSYFHRGTIEFRLKEGTLDPTELIFWPLFCGWIVESAVRLRDEEVRSIACLEDWLTAASAFVQPAVLEWVRGKI